MFELQVEVVDDQVVEKASNCDFHEKNSDYVPHSRAVVQHHLKEGRNKNYGCTPWSVGVPGKYPVLVRPVAIIICTVVRIRKFSPGSGSAEEKTGPGSGRIRP